MPKVIEPKKHRTTPYEPRAAHATVASENALQIYLDFETTGINVHQERIIEIGATAGGESFSSYVYTDKPIGPKGKNMEFSIIPY